MVGEMGCGSLSAMIGVRDARARWTWRRRDVAAAER